MDMSFSFSNEQHLIIETASKIGKQFGLDYWRDHDARQVYPTECWQAICDAGLCGAMLPERHGGGGLGMVELALIIEELCAGGAGATLSQIFMLNPIFGGVALMTCASEDRRAELLPPLCRGELHVCMALTEPDAGTNTLNMKSFAEPSDKGWRLNGQKIWITGVPNAHKMLVVARTTKLVDAAKRTDGISLFLIDVDRAGLSHTPIEKAGTNTLPSSSVHFEDVEIAADELLGELDKGWLPLLDVLNTERIVTTAGLVGAGRLALGMAVDFAKDRTVFGDRPIGAYQGIQFPLAQHWAELEAARLLNLKAAWLYDQGLQYASESNAAKLIASQAASGVMDRAMQTMGGMGYATAMHIERLWRDTRLFKVAPVSEEMILNYIATANLGLPRGY